MIEEMIWDPRLFPFESIFVSFLGSFVDSGILPTGGVFRLVGCFTRNFRS